MLCPVHNVWTSTCGCALAMHPHFCDCDRCLNGKAVAKKRTSAPVLLALTFAAAVVACATPSKGPCLGVDVPLLANEAACLAQVKERCAGIPLDEPCPFEEECKAFTRERCK